MKASNRSVGKAEEHKHINGCLCWKNVAYTGRYPNHDMDIYPLDEKSGAANPTLFYVHIALVGTKDENADYDHVTLTYSVLATKPWKNVGVTEEDAPKSDEIELTLLDETGVDEDGNTVKLAQGSDGELYVLGAELQSAYTGANIAVTRNFCDASGNVLRSESIGSSSYTYRDRKYLITPYVEPEPEEPDDPWDEWDDPWGDPDGDDEPGGDETESGSGNGSGSGSGSGTFDPWW